VAAALLVGPGLARAAGPTAADRETARTLMDRGDGLAAKKDLAGALAAYEAADALVHVPTTGIEVAKTRAALGRLVEARDAALSVARAPAVKGEPAAQGKARAEAATLAAELAPRIPSLAIAVVGPADDAPLEVSFDGVAVPAAAARLPRKLDPGKHVVTVACEGFASARLEVDLVEGAEATRSVSLARATDASPAPPAAAPPAPPPPPSEPRASSSAWPAVMWAGFGVGAAGLAVGGIAGGLSLARVSTLDGACDAMKRCPPAAQPDIDAGKRLALASDIGFGVGVLGVAVGVVAIVVQRSGPPAKAASGLAITPSIGPGSAGIVGTWRGL
jgi:hypothetical protein